MRYRLHYKIDPHNGGLDHSVEVLDETGKTLYTFWHTNFEGAKSNATLYLTQEAFRRGPVPDDEWIEI